MKVALVAGGWHFPAGFIERGPYERRVDRFIVCHRDPVSSVVKQEGTLGFGQYSTHPKIFSLDLALYEKTVEPWHFSVYGWGVEHAANIAGDWVFLNQWLDHHDPEQYDAVVFAHDDTYWRDADALVPSIEAIAAKDQNWLAIGNGRYPEAPEGYLRGSFEVFNPRLFAMLGGRIPVGELTMTREGLTDTPKEFDALSPWNSTCEPLRQWFVRHGLVQNVHYFSDFYRISEIAIEGERGWLHKMEGAPWSYMAGLKHFGIIS